MRWPGLLAVCLLAASSVLGAAGIAYSLWRSAIAESPTDISSWLLVASTVALVPATMALVVTSLNQTELLQREGARQQRERVGAYLRDHFQTIEWAKSTRLLSASDPQALAAILENGGFNVKQVRRLFPELFQTDR